MAQAEGINEVRRMQNRNVAKLNEGVGIEAGKGAQFIERKLGELTIRIDRTICVGFGDCVSAAPEAFELDGEGIAVFGPRAETVGRERLMRACDACPVDAIIVLDADGNQLVP